MHFRALFVASLILTPSISFAQTRAEPGLIIVPSPDPVLTTTAPAPAPIPVPPKPTLEQTQQAVETAADLTSGPVSHVLSAIAGALGGILALLGVQQALKRKDGKNKCLHCQGSGETPAVCSRCNGTKEVEQEYEPKMDCAHCEGSGKDPEERRDKDGNLLDCEECKGEGEVSAKLNVSVPCPDCN